MMNFTLATIPPVVGGMVDFPTLAAFVSWFLIAALVGSALGILREATSGRSRSVAQSGRAGRPPRLAHPMAPHAHGAAA